MKVASYNHDSVKVVVDDWANAVTRMEYLPYGETGIHEGDTDHAPKYNSQELDKETNFYFYNARHYDPEISRFVTPDSIIDGEFDTQGWNRFSYVKENPIVYKDPTGHQISQFGERWYDLGGHSGGDNLSSSSGSQMDSNSVDTSNVAESLQQNQNSDNSHNTNNSGNVVDQCVQNNNGNTNTSGNAGGNNSLNQQYLQTQQNLIGENYVWGGNDPEDDGGVDCSGAVLYGINEMGYEVEDMRARDIHNNLTIEIDREDLQAGDLIFNDWNNDGLMDHVTTYDGENRINPIGDSSNTADNPGSIEVSRGVGNDGIYRRIDWENLSRREEED